MNVKQCYIPYDCQDKIRKQNQSLVKCGAPNNLTIPVGTVAGTTYIVASLELNLNHYCNPSVNLEFSSLITLLFSIAGIDFQIFKQCQSQLDPVIASSIWSFARLAPGTGSEAFTFLACDDGGDCGCCTYTVVATVTTAVTIAPVTINNAMLSASVVDHSGC